jgi:hypothetical protein
MACKERGRLELSEGHKRTPSTAGFVAAIAPAYSGDRTILDRSGESIASPGAAFAKMQIHAHQPGEFVDRDGALQSRP